MKTGLLALVALASMLTLSASQVPAQDKDKPGDTPFAYAAPAFIKELDTRFPAQPPVPPSPPRYGGVLHFPATVRAFDPTAGYRPELALVWDTLTEWEATWYFPEVQRTPAIRKTLVTDWQMQTPSTWIFKLRPGVKFHNRPPVNGRELVAEDVKYSYELLKDKAQYSTRAALVKTITVLDKYTVRFDLAMPDPKFHLNIVDSLSPVIVPREAVEAPGGLAENPIGTGAFMLKEFSPGDGALLVKNPDYHLKDKDGRSLPYVDAVRLYFTRDAATETALFRSKQVDVMRVSTLDQIYALMKTAPDLMLYRVPSFGWGDYGISMALDKAPFSDVRVRQALSMAINRDIVAEVINKGDAALYGPFPWALAGYTKRADYSYANLGPNYQYNPKETRRLLAAAGYPKGFDAELEWGEFPGMDLRRVRTTSRALLSGRGDPREAQATRDIDVDFEGGRRAALQSDAGRLQPYRRRPELHGLGLPALSRLVPEDDQSRAHPGPAARRHAHLVADRSRRQAPAAAARHLGPPAPERVPHHDDRAAPLPHHPVLRARRG
jgi:ABC-type transport system substrate-binding protein